MNFFYKFSFCWKKKSKHFIVTLNDAKKEIFVEKVVEKSNKTVSVEVKKKEIEIAEEIKNKPKSKIILGRKKKSSTISINSSFNKFIWWTYK